MKLKLKEDPREWRKFALAAGVFAGGVLWLASRRHLAAAGSLRFIAAGLILVLLAGLVRPRLIRPLYRFAMTGSFYVGQVMGRVLLAVVFLFVLTPLALLLRLAGKDLLRLRRDPRAETYWRAGKWIDDFDRQF